MRQGVSPGKPQGFTENTVGTRVADACSLLLFPIELERSVFPWNGKPAYGFDETAAQLFGSLPKFQGKAGSLQDLFQAGEGRIICTLCGVEGEPNRQKVGVEKAVGKLLADVFLCRRKIVDGAFLDIGLKTVGMGVPPRWGTRNR